MLFSSVVLGLGLGLALVGAGDVAVAVVVSGLEGSEAFCIICASSLEGLAAVLVFVSDILCLNRLNEVKFVGRYGTILYCTVLYCILYQRNKIGTGMVS